MAKNQSNLARTAINIASNLGVMVMNLAVSFFLSPYIIRTIGIEANGFAGLAGSFTSYANLVVLALNAMAARFITIAYVRKDYEKANLYYNSVFWGNLILCGVLLLPAVFLIFRLETFVEIPAHLVTDVKILFSLVFLSFFLGTAAPNWECGTIVTNRLDRAALPSIFTSLLRCVLLVTVFSLFTPKVWYVTAISLLLAVIGLAIRAYNTHTLTPELRVNLKKPVCSGAAIRELVGAGIWNSIANAGNTLLIGLDLLVCNLSLGPTAMGMLGLSKTLPNILVELSESLRGTFGPEMTILYAKGDKNELVRIIRRDIKITMVIVSVAVSGIMVMSDVFYSLWVPGQDAKLLQVLTTLALLRYITDSGITVLANVFPTCNKVKYNAIGLLISGSTSILVTLLLVRFTDWDLYAVAGVSSVVAIVRSITFLLPASSTFLGLKWYTFYPQMLQSVMCCAIAAGIGMLIKQLLPMNSWLWFFLGVAIVGSLSLCANMFLVLSSGERAHLLAMVRRKFKK